MRLGFVVLAFLALLSSISLVNASEDRMYEPSFIQEPGCEIGNEVGPGEPLKVGFRVCGVDATPPNEWWQLSSDWEQMQVQLLNIGGNPIDEATTVGGQVTFTAPYTGNYYVRILSWPAYLKSNYLKVQGRLATEPYVIYPVHNGEMARVWWQSLVNPTPSGPPPTPTATATTVPTSTPMPTTDTGNARLKGKLWVDDRVIGHDPQPLMTPARVKIYPNKDNLWVSNVYVTYDVFPIGDLDHGDTFKIELHTSGDTTYKGWFFGTVGYGKVRMENGGCAVAISGTPEISDYDFGSRSRPCYREGGSWMIDIMLQPLLATRTPTVRPTATNTRTTVPSRTPSPTRTPTVTRTTIPSATPTVTRTPTPTATPTDVPAGFTPSATPIPTDTPVPSSTPVPSDTPTPTDTLVPSSTPEPSDTPMPTDTPMATATVVVLPQGEVCSGLVGQVPDAVLNDALANPYSQAGWGELCQPNSPESPFNPFRSYLRLEIPSRPYHPLWNAIMWACGCS